MKNTIKNALVGMFVIAVSPFAFAGVDTSKDVIQDQSLVGPAWFAGGSVAYMDEADTEFYTLHSGVRFQTTDTFSWSLYGEVGYAESDSNSGGVDVDAYIVPVTINAEARYHFTDTLSLYGAVGVGVAYTNVDVRFGGLKAHDSSWEFVWQAKAGVSYAFAESWEAFAEIRYIDVDYGNGDSDDVTYGVGVTYFF